MKQESRRSFFFKFFPLSFLQTHSKETSFPTNIGITRGTQSVAILVVVSDGVDIWVAHLYSVSVPGQMLEQ